MPEFLLAIVGVFLISYTIGCQQGDNVFERTQNLYRRLKNGDR